jgi:hypothetical protein
MREVEVKFRVRDLEALVVGLKGRGIELGEPAPFPHSPVHRGLRFSTNARTPSAKSALP